MRAECSLILATVTTSQLRKAEACAAPPGHAHRFPPRAVGLGTPLARDGPAPSEIEYRGPVVIEGTRIGPKDTAERDWQSSVSMRILDIDAYFINRHLSKTAHGDQLARPRINVV